MFYSWLLGPLLQNAYHLGPTLSAPHKNSVARSSLSRRVSLIWEAELWKGTPEGLNPHGKKKPFKFPKWTTCLSSVMLSVCQQLTVSSDRLRSTVWTVARADSPTLSHCAEKGALCSFCCCGRAHWDCCSSLTPPCVKANSEALFKKQLLRRCTISWNDLLTFLPLLISKKWIIRITGVGCLAHFFRSKKPGPQIPVSPKRDSLIKRACNKAGGAGSPASSSHHLVEWGKRMAHARKWMGHDWSKVCPKPASLRALTTALLDDKWAQFSQGLSQRSCSTGWHVVYSITYCSRVDPKQWGNGWAAGRSRVTGEAEETTTILFQSFLQPNIII